ncbi:hypothetical protein AB1Y20_013773 [Prymnesium parvum]|uniref:Cyclic nucleotide-binding domain-containing protein n=1 Tax=Prymnesium parvum TaxID=97485 RepID=A0AB34IH89_PRYPA
MSEGTGRGCRLSLSDFRQTYAAVQRAVTSLEKPRSIPRLPAEAEPPRARRQTHGPPTDGWSAAISGDSSLAVANRSLFALPPPRRSHAQLAMLRGICAQHAAPFFGSLSAAQQREFVRACALRQCARGEVLCEPSEHADAFHLIAAGEVILKEPQLHHRMTSHERKPPWVTRTLGPGEHFGHFPLVTGASRCGYAAQVASPTAADQSNEPAILLFLRREDYEAIIKPEARCPTTPRNYPCPPSPAAAGCKPSHLTANPPLLTARSLMLQLEALLRHSRLFFSFKQIHVSPDEDVMVQGDAADCCYVIQSGECDVLVRSEPPRDAPAADSDAPAPSPAPSFRKKPALAALISAQIAQMKSKTTDEQPAQVPQSFPPPPAFLPLIISTPRCHPSSRFIISHASLPPLLSLHLPRLRATPPPSLHLPRLPATAPLASSPTPPCHRSSRFISHASVLLASSPTPPCHPSSPLLISHASLPPLLSLHLPRLPATPPLASSPTPPCHRSSRFISHASLPPLLSLHLPRLPTTPPPPPHLPRLRATPPPSLHLPHLLNLQEEAAPLQQYRAVARLGAGQLVGEIALLNPGTTRGATVRAVGAVSLLRLDRSTFARLDPRTLAALADHSLGRVLRNTFQRVCAKPPHLRTEEDLDVLHSSGLPPAWHKVICRVMTYLKFGEGEVLARCGDPAAAMYILTVGTVRVSDPSGLSVRSIGPGGCIGHEELLLHASRFASTALVCESLAEAMQISRADFDDFLRHPFSVLPSDATASFLRACPSLRNASPPAVQQLARVAQRKRFARASHCLCYPPPQRTARVLHASPAVSPSSFFEAGFVYFVSQGEATLFCDQYIGEHPAQLTSRDLCKRPHYGRNHLGLPLGLPKYSPAPPSPRPHSARPSSAAAPKPTTPKAQRRFLPVATYTEKEVLIEELFNCGGSCSWYLLPTTSWFEVIAVPRKAWQEAISPSALAEVRKLTFQRAVLYEELMYRACLAQQRRIRTLQLGT